MTTAKATRPEVPDKLMNLFLGWQQAQQRLQQAQQTLGGAQAQAIEAESRFKGVAEYLYGPEFTFRFEDGKLSFDPHGNPGAKPESNGHTTMTPQQLNRAARRALARGKKP